MSTKPVYVTASDGLRAMQVKLHTKEKLHYISRYIEQFCTSMKDKWPIRNYIDLLSGPGLCFIKETGEEIPASVLYACQHKHPCTSYFINDIDPNSVKALQQRVSYLSNEHAKPNFNITCEDCNVVVDQTVSTIRKSRSLNLAVLDGFGIECNWQTVQKLASCQNMDLIILFPGNMTIVRNAELWSQTDDARLDVFMPDNQWHAVWTDKRLSGAKASADLLNLYIAGLKQLGYGGDELVQTRLIKSETGAPLYHLILASKHPLGIKLWKNAVAKDDRGQISLF